MSDIRQLTQDYLHFAANETDKKGNKRAATTMTSYRRALEGFAAAVEQSGLDLTELPESFIEKNWLATQQSIINQTIQLRVRAAAVKQFTNWLFRNNVPCAPMRHLAIKTPPPKPKQTKENDMSDVTSLGDAMLQADPVPSTQSQPQYVTYEPQLPAPPPPAPRQAAPQAPAAPRQQKAPVGPGRPSNPLASMLPTGHYKMRVRREREADDPVWLGDYPAERVAAAGAVEPFIHREVVPKLLAQGLTGDITFLVSALSPDGREGERARITVAVVPQAPVQTVPAPVAGVAAAPVPVPAGMQPNEMADMLSYHRRAQEELEERIAKKLEAQQAANKEAARPVVTEAPKNSGELDDLKKLVGQLAGTVQNLAARLEEREMDRMDRMEQLASPPPQPVAPQLDILSVIREVTNMTKAQQPAPAAQPMGLGEVFSVMAQAKQMFQPQNVNIDVSPLEDQIADLRHQLSSQAKKKDEITEMVEKFKAMKELFGLVGGETSASKPTNGLGSALGGLFTKVLENPAPLADAVERILTATAQVKAASNGVAPPPRAAQPAPQQVQLPPQLGQAAKALLEAESDEATVVAAHEWLTMVLQVPQLRKAGERITDLIKNDKLTELAIYLRQVLSHLGEGERATADRCKVIAAAIMAQVKAANQEDDEEGDEDESGPDLTVRVGGVRAAAEDGEEEDESDDEEDEYEDESDDEDEEDSEDEELEAAAEENAESNEVDLDTVSHDELSEVLASSEPAPVEEAPKPRRKRRTKAEMAAARAAEAGMVEQVVTDPSVAVPVVDVPPETVVT